MAENIQIPYTSNIAVAPNELYIHYTINRNLEKLLANDNALIEKLNKYSIGSLGGIQPYREDYVYDKGDIVIFIDKDQTKVKNVYLLESTVDNNDLAPQYDIVNGFVSDFSKTNWKNLNEFYSIYNSDDETINLSNFLEYAVSSNFHLSHEVDQTFHKFGEIHEDTVDKKLLKNDFSNIADSRNELFFSYETKKVDADNFSGYYKKWGNGVIEYDLTFCLGENLKVEKTINSDGSIVATNYMKLNSLVPLSSDDFNNDDYFMSEDDYLIFNKSGSTMKYNVNGIAQTNATDQVNEYHGTIVFPIPFADTNYMVFASGRTRNDDGKIQSPNALTFTNRKKESITAVYLIPNYNGESLQDVLLRNNVFQCQIVGRWKK